MICPDCGKDVRLWRLVGGWEEYHVDGTASDTDPQGSMDAPTGDWEKFTVISVDVACGCDPCPWQSTFDGDITRTEPKECGGET